MKIFRDQFVVKLLSLFLLLTFVQTLFIPSVSVAQAVRPHQPEFTSYEEPGATDMVNLLTGDFTFSLPILEVPGPEGGFSLPLSYHAGIGNDQEASWVGLGFSLNPGAINRNIVGFPDDASGEQHGINVQDLTGVRGWTSSILGNGNIGWNSVDGHYGTIKLSLFSKISYNNGGLSSVGISGFTLSNKGMDVEASQIGMDLMTVVMTVATWGAYGAVAAIANTAVGLAVDRSVSAIVGSQTPISPSTGYWEYSKREEQRFLHKNYWIWLDQTRLEDMYGVLYLNKPNTSSYADPISPLEIDLKVDGVKRPLKQFASVSSRGAASDISYYLNEGVEYSEVKNPVSLAIDNYSVNGLGISGNIKPYRFDIGSVAVPREMSKYHTRFSPIGFEEYKVPFIYHGSLSNNYYHHMGGTSSVSPTVNNFGIDHILGNTNPIHNTALTLNMNDIVFETQKIREDEEITHKIAQKNHIEWFTNDEIANELTPYKLGYTDFLKAEDRTNFREVFEFGTSTYYGYAEEFSTGYIPLRGGDVDDFKTGEIVDLNISYHHNEALQSAYYSNIEIISLSSNGIVIDTSNIGSEVLEGNNLFIVINTNKIPSPKNTIGGFSITRSDGLTFHYALPVYNYEQKTEIIDKSDPAKRTLLTRDHPFAHTWLLTSITGSDYIDRNNNGIVDDEDWGYWVSLNYNRSYNTWRNPLSGTKRDSKDQYDTYTEGKMQVYYLNSIHTRSHTAIFVKSGKRLDEIILMDNTTYETLTASIAEGGYGLASSYNTVDEAWTVSDFKIGSEPREAYDYLTERALKRIVFHHSHSLSKDSQGDGKLTLERISVYGRNGKKVMPDYRFEYGFNPDYNIHHWDGWGMYNPAGTDGAFSHKASEEDLHGAAWSLSKIITPLGSSIGVEYERDTYSTIAGNKFIKKHLILNDNWEDGIVVNNADQYFKAGDRITIEGNAEKFCGYPPVMEFLDDFFLYGTVKEVMDNNIKLDLLTPNVLQCSPDGSYATLLYTHALITNQSYRIEKRGGDIRVSKIIVKDDDGNKYETRYRYNKNIGTNEEVSSGVVAQEPDYIKTNETDYYFYNQPDYPFTPVLYEQVTVTSGPFRFESEFHTKQVYEFHTPHFSQVYSNSTNYSSNKLISALINPIRRTKEYLTESLHSVDINTSKIGKLKSIKTYDSRNKLVSNTALQYSSTLPQDQGLFTEGTLLAERVSSSYFDDAYIKFTRTTKKYHPYTLKKITNVSDGMTNTIENTVWDFISGNVLETVSKNSLGITVKTVTVPAYHVYEEMGPKSQNQNNNIYKNMLRQTAGTYIYKLDEEENETGLLAANIQTWSGDDYMYRVSNGTGFVGQTPETPVWRIKDTYAYKGEMIDLQDDGTLIFNEGDKYDFENPSLNVAWQYMGGITKYDHFSKPIETKDINGLYAAMKMDSRKQLKIAEAINAKYTEFAFSGAEDVPDNNGFFGGEISKGSMSMDKTEDAVRHTGHYAGSLGGSSKGFIYKAKGSELTTGRTYRISVWAHKNNVNSAKIYYKVNGGQEIIQGYDPNKKAGDWYQLNLEIPIGEDITSLEAGCYNSSTTQSVKNIFDDFRFQPIDAQITTYVYDQGTGNLTYALDNNNLFIRYEYDDAGHLIRTYREIFDKGNKVGGEKLVSEMDYNYGEE